MIEYDVRPHGYGVDWTGKNLSRLDFGYSNFSGCIFNDANLNELGGGYTNFSNSQMERASLRNARLAHTNFRYANLTSADLSGAELPNANFTYAILKKARLNDLYIIGTDFIGADLEGAFMDGHVLNGQYQRFGPTPSMYDVQAFGTNDSDTKWYIIVGCRRKTLEEAREHWNNNRHRDSNVVAWFASVLDLLEMRYGLG